MTTNSIDQEIQKLSEIIGVDPSDLNVENPRWLDYMRDGVIVNVHIRRWRAVTRLTSEHLGLDFQDEAEQKAIDETLSLGNLYLLPVRFHKQLNAIESGARKAAKRLGFDTYWGLFMPAEAFEKWTEESDNFETRYQAVAQDIYDNFDDLINEVADLHSANARAAYRRLMTLNPSQLIEKGDIPTESQFVARYVDTILDAIPTRDEVMASFGYEVSLTYVPLPSLIEEVDKGRELEIEKIQAEREKTQAEVKMHRAVLARAQEQKEQLVTGWVKDMVSQLNTLLYEAATDVLETTERNQNIHPRSVVQLRQTIERIRSLNFFDYSDIDQILTKAELEISKEPESRSREDLTKVLKDVATLTRANLLSLGESVRSGRAANIEDVPSGESVRQARKNLGLVEVVTAPDERRQRRSALNGFEVDKWA